MLSIHLYLRVMSFFNILARKQKKKCNRKLIKFGTFLILIIDLKGNRKERKSKQFFSAHAHLNSIKETHVFHLLGGPSSRGSKEKAEAFKLDMGPRYLLTGFISNYITHL